MSEPRFTVSILTYSAVRQAKLCIASVLKSTVPFKLILTANGNPLAAEFFHEVAREFPFAKVIVNLTNEGFIKPNLAAFAECDTEFFVLLNDDTVVPPDWLEKLVAPFDLYPAGALSGPRGGCQSLQQSFHGFKGPGFEYLEGSCLCIKTAVARKHGLFDPNLVWAYGEDSDLSLRMRELGYTLHHADFTLQHEIGATSKYVTDVRRHQAANHAYLIKRWGSYLRARKMEYPTVVRRGAAFGDVLLTTVIIQALHAKRPLSPIFVETLLPQIFLNNPLVTKSDRRIDRSPDALIFDLTNSYEQTPDRHILQSYAERCGLTMDEIAPFKTQFFPTELDDRYAARLVPDGEWVAVHPGPNTWRSKEWPVERFAEVIRLLRGMGHKVLLVGSAGKPLVADLDERGHTTIHQTASLLKRCKLFIGLDSFPLHCAEAMGVRAIGLFGVTDPKFIITRPENTIAVCGTTESFGLRHRMKNTNSVDDGGAAMQSITVEMVMAAVMSQLPTPAAT